MKTRIDHYYFNAQKPRAGYEIGVQLTELILQSEKALNNIVVLCIGTDRSTGDSLGPIVGYKLTSQLQGDFRIYGTLESPVHAANLSETILAIKKRHGNPFIIAIDASLGTLEHIGYVTIGNGPLRPGLGVNKALPDVGDIHITGIVNLSGGADPMLLQTTRLRTVMNLADVIVSGILNCLSPSQLLMSNSDAGNPFLIRQASYLRSLSSQACALIRKLQV